VLTKHRRHHPRHYGWYHRHLWASRVGARFLGAEATASPLHRFHSAGRWSVRRPGWFGCWYALSHPRIVCLLIASLGFAIGIVGDAGVRGTAQQPRLFVGMILILIFAEVLGLYGLIVALLMNAKATTDASC